MPAPRLQGEPVFFSVMTHSEDIDERGALDELMGQCRAELGDRTPQAGLLFAGHDMDHAVLLDGICDTWPDIVLVGCATDGEVSSRLGFRQDSVALVLFGSDVVEFTAGVGHGLSTDVEGACGRAIDAAADQATLEPAICLVFPESMTASGQAIVEAVTNRLGDGVPVLGGLSGDGREMNERTKQFFGREVSGDSISVLLMSGPLVYSTGVASGWEPMGEPGLVTRSENKVLYEIDGRPAIEFFRRLLGPDAVPTPEFPLAVLDAQGTVESLRTPIGEHETLPGAIACFSDVREGVMVQIATADRAAILDGCSASIGKAFADYPHGRSPAAALVFSCAARRTLLGTRTEEEISLVKSVLGPTIPVMGFYAYGEIGPNTSADGVSNCHYETFVSLILGT